MVSFFRICNYLQISPATFFDDSIKNTDIDKEDFFQTFRKLRPNQAEHIYEIMKCLTATTITYKL